LIFLRFAEARFAKRRAELEKAGSSGRLGSSRIDEPSAYHAEGVVYLTPDRYERLLNLPEGENVGKEVNEAIADIEKHNPHLAGVLPRTYQIFNSTLLKQLLKKVSEIPETLEYDAFSRIYEYFLGEFARTEGQKGGEFFTPSSIVRLIVQILEPYHGRSVAVASLLSRSGFARLPIRRIFPMSCKGSRSCWINPLLPCRSRSAKKQRLLRSVEDRLRNAKKKVR
jgi:type I restriction enzyme M protein